MKKIFLCVILIAFIKANSLFAVEPPKSVFDNTGGANAKITFQAEAVKLLKIESTTLVLDIGKLSAGETKILGEKYNGVFHLTGVANAKFVINLVNENFSSNGVTLQGVNWEYRNSESYDYTRIISFPFISQLNKTSGDGWIKVYPESIRADENSDKSTVNFEFKFNCSYYEL